MDLKLKGKTALVTGSTAGIGLAIATMLAKENANVILNGRTQQRVSEAINTVKAVVPNASVRGWAGDLTRKEAVAELVKTFERVDILVNNLGVYASSPLEDVDDEVWLSMFSTNVLSGARLS